MLSEHSIESLPQTKTQKVMEFAQSMGHDHQPALIVGEKGTGKRTLCRSIHDFSERKNFPFEVVDCSLESKTVENLILGYRENDNGRFNKGAIEKANGGTVVLANIDCLSEEFQKRIMTIINELKDYDLNVRLMATTTKNLSKYVGAGRFHRSLFSYFSQNQMAVPALRERAGEIGKLSQDILKSLCAQQGRGPVQLSADAVEKLESHYWTHNLKELQDVLEITLENVVDTINSGDIELGERKVDRAVSGDSEESIKLMSLREAEKLLIKKALIHTSENRTQAAKILGVSIRTLRNKINEYRTEGAAYFVNLR